MGDRRALRALVTGLAVGVVIACAACTETGGGPGPTTGSAAATGAVAGSGGFKGGYDPSTKFTQLTAMFLTTPAPVEMTDGKVHLTYELVLTNAAPIPFQVDNLLPESDEHEQPEPLHEVAVVVVDEPVHPTP